MAVRLIIIPKYFNLVELKFAFLKNNIEGPSEIPSAVEGGTIKIESDILPARYLKPLSDYLSISAFINKKILIEFLEERKQEWINELLAMIFNLDVRDIKTWVQILRKKELEWKDKYERAMKIINETICIFDIGLPPCSLEININLEDFKQIQQGKYIILNMQGFLEKIIIHNTLLNLNMAEHNIITKDKNTEKVLTIYIRLQQSLIEIIQEIFVMIKLEN